MDNFIEWLINKFIAQIEKDGKTDRAKLVAAYHRIGRILDVVQAAYLRLGDILNPKPHQPIG